MYDNYYNDNDNDNDNDNENSLFWHKMTVNNL